MEFALIFEVDVRACLLVGANITNLWIISYPLLAINSNSEKFKSDMNKTNHWIGFETLVMNSHRESFKGNLKYNVIFHLLYIHNIEQQEKQCSYFSQVQFCSKTSSWSMLHLNKSNPFVFLTARKNFTKKNEWIDIAINCFYYIYSSYISRFTAHIIFIHDHHYF